MRFAEIPRWRKAGVALCALGAVAGLATYFDGALVGNVTRSMPANVYLVYEHAPKIKGLPAAFTPPVGFNPDAPFLKRIAGAPGDLIETDPENRLVYLNGKLVAFAKRRTEGGDPLEMIAPGVIPEGRYFMLGEHRESFDSRFAWVGLIEETDIVGVGFGLPFGPSARPADYEEETR